MSHTVKHTDYRYVVILSTGEFAGHSKHYPAATDLGGAQLYSTAGAAKGKATSIRKTHEENKGLYGDPNPTVAEVEVNYSVVVSD